MLSIFVGENEDMLEMLIGMALGAMAFTEQGHEAGNTIAALGIKAGKAAMEYAESTKQSARAAGNDHNHS
jgi:hypothetical protein